MTETPLEAVSVALPARRIALPHFASAAAREMLAVDRPSAPALPDPLDIEGWRTLVANRNAASAAVNAERLARSKLATSAEARGAPVYAAAPPADELADDKIIMEFHGGALVFGGGETNVRSAAARWSARTRRAVHSVDYSGPPDRPFPTALEECFAVYRSLLAEFGAQRLVLLGTSAGGNLAASTLLKARENQLPMPRALVLLTPELDLTERGDTFQTLQGLDVVLARGLMTANLAYAAGADLEDPYVSPLYGDVRGFPPTFLQSGTRDLFLSNTILMHRKLRAAGVEAELHVWEGMPHGGFGGAAPEDADLIGEICSFLSSH